MHKTRKSFGTIHNHHNVENNLLNYNKKGIEPLVWLAERLLCDGFVSYWGKSYLSPSKGSQNADRARMTRSHHLKSYTNPSCKESGGMIDL